ncbi:MAG TPA: TIGR01777 family oxidoreductase [Bryobacteraceae bacterium]|nr:TIGR01777 family oxidoreductase [Bryobacteraceae bacterium]
MHIAISGATGFVGRRLREILVAHGHTVSRLPRWTTEPGLRLEPPLDAIVHLAGEPVSQRWSKEVKERIRSSRVEGTRLLVSAIGKLAVKPQVLVCASAVGFYGDRGEERLTETSPPGEGFLPDVCQAWETEAGRAAAYGVRVVKIRTGLALGRNGGALAKMLLPFRLGLGARLGDGNQWMSWIHLDDLAEMMRFAIEAPGVSGAWNGVSPHPVTNREFTRALGKAVHRPTFLVAPKALIMLGAGEMAQILFASQRCLPEAPLAAGFSFRYPELGPALQAVVD